MKGKNNIEDFFKEEMSGFRMDPPKKVKRKVLLVLLFGKFFSGYKKYVVLAGVATTMIGGYLYLESQEVMELNGADEKVEYAQEGLELGKNNTLVINSEANAIQGKGNSAELEEISANGNDVSTVSINRVESGKSKEGMYKEGVVAASGLAFQSGSKENIGSIDRIGINSNADSNADSGEILSSNSSVREVENDVEGGSIDRAGENDVITSSQVEGSVKTDAGRGNDSIGLDLSSVTEVEKVIDTAELDVIKLVQENVDRTNEIDVQVKREEGEGVVAGVGSKDTLSLTSSSQLTSVLNEKNNALDSINTQNDTEVVDSVEVSLLDTLPKVQDVDTVLENQKTKKDSTKQKVLFYVEPLVSYGLKPSKLDSNIMHHSNVVYGINAICQIKGFEISTGFEYNNTSFQADITTFNDSTFTRVTTVFMINSSIVITLDSSFVTLQWDSFPSLVIDTVKNTQIDTLEVPTSSQKDTIVSRTNVQKSKLKYIGIPLSFGKVFFKGKHSFGVHTRARVNFLIKSEETGAEISSENKLKAKKSYLDLAFMLSYGYQLSDKFSLVAKCSYNYYQKNPIIGRTKSINRIQPGIGIRYRFR